MIKNLTSNQLVLIAIAAVLLLMAAFAFYLLQNPSAPLPFAPQATTSTPTRPSLALTIITEPSDTPVPTRQTSYTPFARTITPSTSANPGTPSGSPNPSESDISGSTTPSKTPTKSATSVQSGTSSITRTPTGTRIASTPTITSTLSLGEHGVTGRILQNGTPVSGVVVEFEDDVASRQSTTNPGGHYWFTTLAPGTAFSLTFNQSDNPQLTPAFDIASLAWIEGTLPTGVNTIDLPDFEISLNLNGATFDPQSPVDGATYSASAISTSNPIQFTWSLYSLGGSYHVELGLHGSDQPVWSTGQIAEAYYMWNGTLDNGTHISEGAYWWRVAVTKNLGNYVVVIFTQPWDILFNP